MKPSHHRALYDDKDDGHISVSSSGSIDREEQQSDGEDDKAPEALHRLQRKLTTAMENMERAQLEFFHVERAFQDRKQQKQSETCAEQSVPWSLKVQLYCEFWQQFVVQLRSALCGDDNDDNDSYAYDDESNELAIQALGVLASNVWGETRASPQEVFRNGPIALAPRTRPSVQQHNRRLATNHENESTTVAFSGVGPYQNVAQWVSRMKPAVQSLKPLMLSSTDAQSKSSTTTTSNNVSSSNDKAAAHTASRPRKKVKTCTKEAAAAGNGTGTSHKASAAAGMNGARQSVASEPSSGVQSVAPKPRASETSSSALAAKSPAKSTPAKVRPDARNPSDMIGFFDRLLADRGLLPTASNQQSLTGTSSAASAARPQQHQRKKKVTASLSARKLIPVALEDDDDDDQAALQLVPIPETPSDFSEAIVQIKQEIAGSGQRRVGSATSHAKKKTKMIGTPRYAFNEHLRQQIQDQLGANEVFPDIHIPFPREHLIFDPNEYPLLANHHEVFWQKNIAAYLEMVYYHPVAGDIKRVSLGKTRLLRRQRVLLGKYIETLGIDIVARNLQTQEATFPFFFVKSINSLNSLSSEQLDEHLEYLKEPWRSPVTQAHGISWWEALLRKTSPSGVKKHNVLEISEAAKQQITSAHFRGALGFDTLWLSLSTQSPWKEMLDERRDVRVGASLATVHATYDDEHEHGLPQSPPHRKRVAGKVPMNRESTRTSNGDAERRRWLQHFVNQKDHHAEPSSTSSDEDDEDESGVKLGKRLRTSKD